MSQRGPRGRSGSPVCGVRPFQSSEEYLEAMKEDLAAWLRDLYGLDVDAANFLQVLDTGLVLCQHANSITRAARAFLADAPVQAQTIPVPRAGVSCNGAARPGTFQARDNVSNFIQWCRKEMGIQEALMFETEDLVLRKNVRNVLLCLLELGRRAWRLGVAAPALVRLEQEVDGQPAPPAPRPRPRPRPPAPDLDRLVQKLVSRCTCPVQFSMVKESEGKYRVGNSSTLIFIRILRNHVMVRVGGGWDTLGHYLDKHDPCRCTSLSHKPGNFLKPPAPPVQHEVTVQDGPSQPQPTMTISRSQSPLPPVDWKIYTSSGRKLRPPAPPSPTPRGDRGVEAGPLGETATFPRSQQGPPSPPRKQLSMGDGSPTSQLSPTHRDRVPHCPPPRKREGGYPGELRRGRTPECGVPEEAASQGTPARAPTPLSLQAPEAISKGTSARGPSPPPWSSSPAKAPGPRLPLLPVEADGAPLRLRGPASVPSPSPVKGPTKIPTRPPPAQSPTPGRSFVGALSGNPTAERGRGASPLRDVAGGLGLFRHRNCSVDVGQLDSQVTPEPGEPQGWAPREWEGRYTPLPLCRTEEPARPQGLEEEIVGDMKSLRVGAAPPRGAGPPGIPRSGVYISDLGGRWPEPGGPYDKVIQELAQSSPLLLNVNREAWEKSPPGSSPEPAVASGPANPKGKAGAGESGPPSRASLNTSSARNVSPPGVRDCSASAVSASPGAPKPPPSHPYSDKAKACAGKGKRTLRKPQRVPSIYKLKLRLRIRPRRDHRPEKRPSRIPKPMAYLCLGPATASPSPGGRLSRAAQGRQGADTSRVHGAVLSKNEEGKKEKKASVTPLENGPPVSEGQGSLQLDQGPVPPEEESWV